MLNKEIVTSNGKRYTYEIKPANDINAAIGSNYKLIKFYKTKKTFSDTILGSNIGLNSNGFTSIIAISSIIAIYAFIVMLLSFRI